MTQLSYRHTVRKFVLVLGWVIGLLAIGGFVATRLPIRQSGLLIFIASLLPWLLFASVGMCALAFLLRSRASTILLTCSTLVLAVCYAPLFVPRARTPSARTQTLRVMSYSAWGGNRDKNIEAIASMLVVQHPDVIALQEVDAQSLTAIEQTLTQHEPTTRWHTVADFDIGQAILSRYPLLHTGTETNNTRLLKVLAQTEWGPIAIWNIHAFRPDFTQGGLDFLAYGGGGRPQPQMQGQMDWLVAHASTEKLPLVFMGDFNVPYRSPDHDFLSTVLRDVHWAAGAGFGFTFPASEEHGRWLSIYGRRLRIASPVRLTKIDHIFVSPNIDVLAAHTLTDSAGSDHAPVFAELALTHFAYNR